MENWIIISKFIILAYFSLKFGGSNTGNAASLLLPVLVYICISMLYHILKHKGWKNAALILALTLLIGCSIYINPLFLLLMPMTICELTLKFSENLWIAAFTAAIPLIFIKNGYAAEYVLIGAFSLVVFTMSNKTHKRIDLISRENDEIRQENFVLSNRIDRGAEYDKQIKYLTQLEERNKISQEIHDKIGHTISGSLFQLEAARLVIEKDKEKAQLMVQNVIGILREGMESIRATLRNIKPGSEQLGINKIKLMLDELSVNTSVKFNLLYSGNLERISHIQWKIIFENVHEALTNSLKYSEASSITVAVEVLNKFVKAEVRDNGIGAVAVKKGLGIKGIEERSQNLGGKVIIDCSKGFSVITLLPLESEDNADKIVNS